MDSELEMNAAVENSIYAEDCPKIQKHIKRPLNAFMLFSKFEREKIKTESPNRFTSLRDLVIFLGKKWSALDMHEKKKFHESAEKLKKQFMKENPDYKFQPKRKKDKMNHVLAPNAKLKKLKADLAKTIAPIKIPRPAVKTVTVNPVTKSLTQSHLSKPPASSPIKSPSKELIVLPSTTQAIGSPSSSDFLFTNETDFPATKTDLNQFMEYSSINTRELDRMAEQLHFEGRLSSGPISVVACNTSNTVSAFDFLCDKLKGFYPVDLDKEMEILYKEMEESIKMAEKKRITQLAEANTSAEIRYLKGKDMKILSIEDLLC